MKKIITIIILTLFLTGCTISKDVKINTDKNESLIETHKETHKETNNGETYEETYEESYEETNGNINNESLVRYLNNIDNEVSAIALKDELTTKDKKTLKDTFITLTDFIFYNGTIKGKTFKELNTETKEYIMNIYNKIDAKIESRIPGYKDTLKDIGKKTYNNLKQKKDELQRKVEEKYIEEFGIEKFNETKKNYEESKQLFEEAFKNTSDKIKDKTKDVYEDAKDKADKWYQDYKESRD